MSIKFSDIFGSAEFNINNPKFEEMINKTRDVAESVGKKSAEHLYYSRKKIESLDLKAKLAKQYEKFGRLNYEASVGSSADQTEMEETAQSIASLKERLDLLTAELEELKEAFRSDAESFAAQNRKSSSEAETADISQEEEQTEDNATV